MSGGGDKGKTGSRHRSLPRALREKCGVETWGELWDLLLDNIKDRLGMERYGLWFRQMELMDVTDERFVVGVPNPIILQFVSERYGGCVSDALADLVGRDLEVTFDVAPRLFRALRAKQWEDLKGDGKEAKPAGEFRDAQQADDHRKHWGFEHLVVTKSNRFTFAAAKEFAGQPNPRIRFLYVQGDYGVGKSCLMKAIYALASGTPCSLNCAYLSAEDWCNDYYHAIQRKTTHAFRNRYRSCDVLLLEDVQFLEGKPAGQLELLHSVKHILSHGGRVALSGVPQPDGMSEVKEGFRSLLSRAFPTVLVPPKEDERGLVVGKMVEKWGLEVTSDAQEFVSDVSGDGFAGVEAAVRCLFLYTTVDGCDQIDVAAARKALSTMIRSAPAVRVTIGRIKEVVVAECGVRMSQLQGGSRASSVVRARHVAMLLSRELTEASLTDIGRAFGGRTHSTVKHAVDKIGKERQGSPELDALLRRLVNLARNAS